MVGKLGLLSDFGVQPDGANDNYYVVNGAAPTTTTLTLEDSVGNVIDTTMMHRLHLGGNIYQPALKNNLFATGGANTITWEPVVGAAIYNVYKFQADDGYIGQTAGSSLVDDKHQPRSIKNPAACTKPCSMPPASIPAQFRI